MTIALHTVRLTVINTGTSPAVLAAVLLQPRNLAPARRHPRSSPRCVKRTLPPYAYNKIKGSVGHKTAVTITITLTSADRP
ncbi:hypothetical protein [Streptomyces sp. NPDC003710]